MFVRVSILDEILILIAHARQVVDLIGRSRLVDCALSKEHLAVSSKVIL